MRREEGNIEGVYPLTPLQEGMIYRSEAQPGSGEFVVQLTFRLRGRLELENFKAAWNQVVARHGALRSCFAWKLVDRPVRVVRQKASLPVETVDLTEMPQEQQRRGWEDLCANDRHRQFDLTAPPLMRILACRFSQQEYRIAWTHHHLILDGWSLPLVLAEVFEVYDALVLGDILQGEAEPPYDRYLECLAAAGSRGMPGHWRSVLEGFEGAKGIPPSRRASPLHWPEYGELELRLPAATKSALDLCARRAGVPASVILQSAWAVVQQRMSGRNDLLFGILTSGRMGEMEDMDRAVGMFVNILPLRVEMGIGATVEEFIRQMGTINADLQESQHAPVGDFRSGHDRAAQERYFDALFVYENYPGNDISPRSATGLEIEDVSVHERGDIPLTLMVTPQDGVRVQLIFDSVLYEERFARSVLSAYACVLGQMLSSPSRRLGELSLLVEAERVELLEGVNATAVPVGEATLVERFEAQVWRDRGRAAVEYEGQVLSYGELNARANRLGRYLRGLGVGPEVLVGVSVERSLELVVVLLGVLKAGGAYVPLDPSYPKARLAAMLEDAKPAVVVTQSALLGLLPTHAGRTVCVDGQEAEAIGAQAVQDLGTPIHPDNAVYCLYTSGSTGSPKGVIGTYRALSNRFSWMERAYPGPRPQRVVHRSALNFVDSVAEIFAPLTHGDCVLIWSARQVADAGRQLATVAESRAHLLMTVPSILAVALDTEVAANSTTDELRLVGVGGEPTSMLLCKRFRQARPGVRLLHLYGATETAADVMVYEIDADNENSDAGNAPIGRPISNMQVYVLDAWLEPVPMGVVGEIYLGGMGLARGYLARPDLTAERFVPDPFGPPGSRLYRTGDAGRWLNEGVVDCLGRADQQVKVRGHRIELGEVESVLGGHPGVKESAVMAREYGEGDKRLVAYVVRRAGQLVSVEGLRQWVSERLPGYMVPAVWEWLPGLPLTPNGKVDRKALPEPGMQAAEAGYEPPRGEMERLLVGVWERVLKMQGLGVNHNFFDVGGDSMLLLRVQAELSRQFGHTIPLLLLIQHPTIKSMADHLTRLAPEERTASHRSEPKEGKP